jgi:hypothetical protein
MLCAPAITARRSLSRSVGLLLRIRRTVAGPVSAKSRHSKTPGLALQNTYGYRSSRWRPDVPRGIKHRVYVGPSSTLLRCLLPPNSSGRHWKLRSLYLRSYRFSTPKPAETYVTDRPRKYVSWGLKAEQNIQNIHYRHTVDFRPSVQAFGA